MPPLSPPMPTLSPPVLFFRSLRSSPSSTRLRAPRSLASAFLSVLLSGLTLGLGGCYSEGGPGFSADQHAYVSTAWQPKTITLRDTRTGEAFWSIDVPVGKKLVVQFRENGAENGQSFGDATPDLMLWDLMPPDEDFGPLANQMPVPPKEARRLDLTLRATPELPATMTGAAPMRDERQ